MLITTEQAYTALFEGNVVALPTETVYGLAGIINSKKTLEKIFTTKQRPFFDPLIVHVADLAMAKSLTFDWQPLEEFLVKNFWPGPLTIIKTKNSNVSDLITSSLPKVALRVPNHPIMLNLIKKLNSPLAAPSANKFKSTSPTLAAHVELEFEGMVPVVDGGACEIGIESTIIEVFAIDNQPSEIKIYRPGIISKEQLQTLLKKTLWENSIVTYAPSNIAPGQLEEHYRPKKPLTVHLTAGDKILELSLRDHEAVTPYSPNVSLAARELYAHIRAADLKKNTNQLNIYFDALKWQDPAWHAIKERLTKAATKITNKS